MTFDDVLNVLTTSSPADWHRVPEVDELDSFLWGLDVWTDASDEQIGISVRGHYIRASYKPDVSLGLAWGLHPEPVDFSEGWTDVFPDRRASRLYADVFWNGMLLHRYFLVSVDGGRAKIPLPDRPFMDSETVVGYSLTQEEFAVGRLIAGIEAIPGGVELYEDYVAKAGIVVADE
jgi:hypothetical protein